VNAGVNACRNRVHCVHAARSLESGQPGRRLLDAVSLSTWDVAVDVDGRSSHPTFGDLLRRYRIAAGLTQEALAERAGLSRRGISDLERGERTHPYRETLRVLADALGLDGAQRRAFVAAGRRSPPYSKNRQQLPYAPLPVPPNPLIGRDNEVARAAALLRDPAVRLLTLTGAGGSGKTRLAIATASHTAADFPDGVVFVDLAPLTDPRLVLGAAAAAARVREQPGQLLLQTLGQTLAARRLLLVLDNFEHLLPAATVASELLAAAPEVKILVTSCARLALAVEHELPVPPLPIPGSGRAAPLADAENSAAVRLFMARAHALKPDFALTAENAADIVDICRRLDGLPLTLELAAARVKLLPPAALLSRLDHALPLLAGGARDLPARQQTLRAAIAWSYDLLNEGDQRLLRRLSVFAGGWTLGAAEAVANHDASLDMLEGLASLVDNSLVRQVGAASADGEPRLAMLETIREFAGEHLQQHAEEEAAIRRSHAAFFTNLAFAARADITAGVPSAIRRLGAEQDNLRAMLAHLLEAGDPETAMRIVGSPLSGYWTVAGGQFSEAHRWLDRALRAGAGASAAARGWAFDGLALITLYQGDFAASRTAADRCRQLAQEAGDSILAMRASFALSLVEEAEGRLDEVIRLSQDAATTARLVGDHATLGWSLVVLGSARFHTGDLDGARSALNEALDLFHGIGGVWGEANTLMNMAGLARAEGNDAQAAKLHAASLRLRHGAGVLAEAFDDLVGIAEIACRMGHAEPAARLLGAEESYRSVYGSVGWGITPVRREQTRRALTAHLGEERFRQAWDEGRAQPTDDVIAAALTLADELATERVTAPGTPRAASP
jgi:predicted ATPase/DNA-binding XRE family transcriptional regulator